MQKSRKNFFDSRNSRNRNLTRLNDELQGVQKIMIDNIDEVLQRGENLSGKIVQIGATLETSLYNVTLLIVPKIFSA